ncbi:ABC transporter ATP-binding protein [Gallibacter intestinalis]|uniref:ABC transporter ATP-binding protein n=1 Tax=Gallibacter intestinalis TaxID=2779356 RepID=A0ABR9QUW2_9FIRM|nr:ABC transporter ATP-binding protein [Gallibacter intestinalis]MBE5034673.1 ABC transporter ATP-binding protein [Gallibacter intestinalis]
MKQVLKFFKPCIPAIILIIALLFGQAMCELALPGYMSDIINDGIIKQDMDYIYSTGIMMLIIAAGSMLCAIGASFFSSRVASRALRDTRSSLFKKITSFSAAEFDQFQTASLITRTTNDIQTVQQTSILILRMACYAPIMGIGALIKALNTSPSLTWTIGLSLLVVLLIMALMFVLVMPKFSVLQSKLDRLNLIVGERLSGLLVVRAFNSETYEEERFDNANRDLTKLGIFVNRAMSFMFPALMLVMNLSGILIVWVGAHMVGDASLMIGDMLAFLQYSMQIIISFLVITMMFIMIPRAIVSIRRIGEVLAVEPSIEDKEEPEHINEAKGVLRFDHVDFAYPDAEEKTLEDISFTALPGQTTAIIGSTGSGKSSLVNLIPRFFDISGGSITLDGVDIRNIPQHELREHIGIVPQKGLLFSGTIASNLSFGKEDATKEEMIDALKTAQALDFVEKMPDGLDTHVAQGGTSVSGGQKQRLSIARALIRNPQVYIFDDSFSALDFKTDKNLRAALKEKVGGSTFIIVAQRINTILDADQIVLLDEGKVAGIGTHKELLASNKIYQEIALSQLSEEELGKEVAIDG